MIVEGGQGADVAGPGIRRTKQLCCQAWGLGQTRRRLRGIREIEATSASSRNPPNRVFVESNFNVRESNLCGYNQQRSSSTTIVDSSNEELRTITMVTLLVSR